MDEHQFLGLLKELRQDITKHCRRMLGHEEDAEDAAQETLSKALCARETYTPAQETPLKHWVMRIATNTCLDMLRKKKFPSPPELEAPDDSFDKAYQEQILSFLRECMNARDFWMFSQQLNGCTLKDIENSLPPEWHLSTHGIKSRFDRYIKPCREKAKKRFQ